VGDVVWVFFSHYLVVACRKDLASAFWEYEFHTPPLWLRTILETVCMSCVCYIRY
jgi:hypothetical protein